MEKKDEGSMAQSSKGGSERGNEQEHHARFREEDDTLEEHDSVIPVDPLGDGHVRVRLGFLKIQHIYSINFSVVDRLGEDVTFDPLENLNARIESVAPSENGQGHDIVIVFNALKEKLIKESVTIKSSKDDSETLRIDLCARVLGKHKGTPALKTGIHILRVEADDESDASDWQGF